MNTGTVDTLGDALPREMARVRDEVIPVYMDFGTPGFVAVSMMRQAFDDAAKAMAAGDLPGMIRAYESLKGFDL